MGFCMILMRLVGFGMILMGLMGFEGFFAVMCRCVNEPISRWIKRWCAIEPISRWIKGSGADLGHFCGLV
ncbi:hypothetical protein HanIR_Chr06g0266161 [Helianthus annuus]|nr:hypothetical protein HanIR_Chr06g0266161 [Helianthus annuus]